MKWLTTVLCLLAISATAQESQPQRITEVPMLITCAPVSPETMLLQEYNEVEFLEGASAIVLPSGRIVQGKIRFFLNPNTPHSYSIIFETEQELYCLVMSGESINPATRNKTEL